MDSTNNYPTDVEQAKKTSSIIELFERITKQSCEALDHIIREEGEDEDRHITVKDFMNDFASDDFLNKNIRVRPVSGRTNVDAESHHEMGGSRHFALSENTDDEENYNKMMKLEMEDQRKNIKHKVI
jgi:hypothetical protein